MCNTNSVVMALNSHFDHHQIELKKILPKSSFTFSLQTRSKLLLLSQQRIFSVPFLNAFPSVSIKVEKNIEFTVYGLCQQVQSDDVFGQQMIRI
ncbi:hypothetical protein Gogos_010503 [Gossypium gossypioides]|uniref:Uncharacterized protein n=1 Tax=Gossypium gossypioides TaxID=34282 RepID=A0A7J9BLH9_GOSGO|nr:hypothetical protein [Gossypium gossypioides]